VQQAYVQKLQTSLEKSSKYKATIKKQESVISKLEAFIKDGLTGEKRGEQSVQWFTNMH
jgi:phage-related protein